MAGPDHKGYVHSMKIFRRHSTLGPLSFASILGLCLAFARPAHANGTAGDSLQSVWETLVDLLVIIT